MDILSYAIASKQSRRIKRFIANPDSDSGIVTVPNNIPVGETVTIPLGRTAVLPDMVIEGDLIIEGEVFIPSGGSITKNTVTTDTIISKDNTVSIGVKDIVDRVRDQDVAGIKNFTSGLKTQSQNITPYSGFKNILINGNFNIWSRGLSGFNKVAQFTADKWQLQTLTDTTGASVQRVSSPNDASGYGLSLTKLIPQAYCFITQAIDSTPMLSGKTVTLSCKVFSTDLDKVKLGINYNAGVDNIAVATSPSNPQNQIINITKGVYNTIKLTVTLPQYIDDNGSVAVIISIGDNDLGLNTNGTIIIRDVQLELGNVATPFEQRDLNLEKFLCGEPNDNNLYNGYIRSNEAYQKGFKNYIINGNFDIWQYKDSSLTYPQVSTGYGSDDRWGNHNIGSTKSHSGLGTSDAERILFNATYYSRTVVNSVTDANSMVVKRQTIEDVTRLAGKTVTLSFWAKADSNKLLQIAFAQDFGTGGSPTAKRFNATPIPIFNLTNTWKKYKYTYTFPNITGTTIGTNGTNTTSSQVYFIFDAGPAWLSVATLGQQSGTFDIAQVQLEEGSIATSFENRHIGLELILCQRYYEMGRYGMYNNSTGTAIVGNVHNFKVTKRLTPSITFNNPGAVQNPSATGFECYQNVTAGTWMVGVFYASAEIQ